MLRRPTGFRFLAAILVAALVAIAGCGDDDGCCYVTTPTPTAAQTPAP